jgi:RND family efflux transporter MFP subunit
MAGAPSSTPLALAMLAVLSLAGCKRDPEPDPRKLDALAQIAVATPVRQAARSYIGTVTARVRSDLGFRVQGKIVERLVDTGQSVKLGQPLMKIDATDYAHAVVAQAGDVAAARARWTQAADDEKRFRGLVATGAVSQRTYDQAKAAADSAQALLSAAEAREKVAKNQDDYSVLVADSDGTIVEAIGEPGQVVAAGQTVIRLAHSGPREAAIDLPETVRPALGSVAQASLYGDTTQTTAHLRQLSDAADPHTRTYEARYVLDGAGAGAPLGATVRIAFTSGEPSDAVQVPLGAIDDEGKGPGVWIFDAQHSTVSYRPVGVGSFGVETAVVTAGVKVGEQVVAAGGHLLHEGQKIRIVPQKAAMQ